MPCNAEVSWFSLTIIWIERGKNKQFTIIFFLSSLLVLLLNCYSIIIVVVRLLLILENCKTFGKMRIVQELNRARAWNVTQTQIRTLRCTNSDTPHTQWHIAAEHSKAQQYTCIHTWSIARGWRHTGPKKKKKMLKKRERIESITKNSHNWCKIQSMWTKTKEKEWKKTRKNELFLQKFEWCDFITIKLIDTRIIDLFLSSLSLSIHLFVAVTVAVSLSLCACVCVFCRHNYAFKHLLNVLQFDKNKIYVK